MWLRTLLFWALSMILFGMPTAEAQMTPSLLRSQSRTIERAVARNLERVFRPKLVITGGGTGAVTALALSADEHTLVSAVGNNTVRLWDLWAGREIARLSGHHARISAVALAADGTHVVTVSEDRSIKVWDLKNLGTVRDLGQHEAPVTDVAITADGARLITAAADGHVRVWSMADGRVERDFQAHSDGPTRIRLLSHGATLVSAGTDGRIRLWDIASGEKLLELDAGSMVTALAVKSDDSLIAAGTSEGGVKLWRPSGEALTSKRGAPRITSIAFSPRSAVLLVGDAGGAVRSWAYEADESWRKLGSHDKAVTYIAASRTGEMALSASEDGTTRLWNLDSGAVLLRLISVEKGWAVIDAKGRYDGNQDALDDFDWQAEDGDAKVEDFAETHYQAALLPRTLAGGKDIPDAASIPDGVGYPATIKIAATPTDSSRPRRVVVEVVAADNGGGVSEIRLYRNGKLVPRGVGDIANRTEDGKSELVGHYDLELSSGHNVLSATAVNGERLESRPQKLSVDAGTAERSGGKIHLVVIGINDYDQPSLALGFARSDADSIAHYLSAPGHTPIPVAETIALIDENATKRSILETLRRLRDVPAEDVVVLYMAGHGVNVGDEWYFISQEVHIPTNLEDLAGMALSSQDLKSAMEALKAERTLVLIDTCQSGAAVMPLNDYRGLKSLRLMARTVGTHVLAATDRDQYAVEIEGLGHGIFTYALLGGLAGKASQEDGLVTASGLIHYVETEVPALVAKYPKYPQYPTGYSRGIDFGVATKTGG